MTRSLRFEAAILLGLLAFFLPSRFVGAQTETPESTASATEPQGATETQNATLNEVQTEELADPNALAAIELYAQGNVEGAFQLFKKVYDANPDSDPPGVLLALLHSHAGRFLDMRRSLEQTAEDYPTDPEAFLQLAGIDVQEGRLLEAQLLVERAEKLIDGYKENRPETVTRLDYLKEEALTARANLAEKRERYDDAEHGRDDHDEVHDLVTEFSLQPAVELRLLVHLVDAEHFRRIAESRIAEFHHLDEIDDAAKDRYVQRFMLLSHRREGRLFCHYFPVLASDGGRDIVAAPHHDALEDRLTSDSAEPRIFLFFAHVLYASFQLLSVFVCAVADIAQRTGRA